MESDFSECLGIRGFKRRGCVNPNGQRQGCGGRSQAHGGDGGGRGGGMPGRDAAVQEDGMGGESALHAEGRHGRGVGPTRPMHRGEPRSAWTSPAQHQLQQHCYTMRLELNRYLLSTKRGSKQDNVEGKTGCQFTTCWDPSPGVVKPLNWPQNRF